MTRCERDQQRSPRCLLRPAHHVRSLGAYGWFFSDRDLCPAWPRDACGASAWRGCHDRALSWLPFRLSRREQEGEQLTGLG
jgi:hypothetical protein